MSDAPADPAGMVPVRPEVGLGPWPGSWPVDDTGDLPGHLDPDLLEHGDRRNVVDSYRYWSQSAIVADLDTRRHDLHVGVENWGHDFNIGSVIRTANAFNVAAFHIVGRRRWNRRGAMVTDRYQHEHHHRDIAGLVAWTTAATGRGIPVIAVENTPEAAPLEQAVMPRSCLLLLGQEGSGLSDEALAAATQVLSITQYGSTRSINAAAAGAIAMHAWARQHLHGQRPDALG